MSSATGAEKSTASADAAAASHRGQHLDAGVTQLRKTLVHAGLNHRQAENAARRGAHGFLVPGTHRARQAHHAIRPEGLGRAQDRAQVPRILQSGKNYHERRRLLSPEQVLPTSTPGPPPARPVVAVSRFPARRSESPAAPPAPRSSSGCAQPLPSPMNRVRNRSPARIASSTRFGPSIPTSPPALRSGLRNARRSSFSRAFCLLFTMRTGISR